MATDADVPQRFWPAVLVPREIAGRIREARAAGHTLDVPLTDEFPLSLDEAYAVQQDVTALRLAAGERVVGWKLGYTSAAMRAQMGIDAPNHGPLTDAMVLSSGATLPSGALQPRVEPEIGLVLGRDLRGPCSIDDVTGACSGAFACLEVVDSVWAGYRFRLQDNTADGSSAAWVIRGAELPLADLPGLGVTLTVDGLDVASATGAAAGGHPAAGVAWLVEDLGRRYDRGLRAGEIVITGGLTAAYPLEPGGEISATYSIGAVVSIRRGKS